MPDSAILLDRNEAAKRLHVSPRTVRRYGKAGLLEERRVGPRLVRVTAESVEALLRGDARPGEAARAAAQGTRSQ